MKTTRVYSYTTTIAMCAILQLTRKGKWEAHVWYPNVRDGFIFPGKIWLLYSALSAIFLCRRDRLHALVFLLLPNSSNPMPTWNSARKIFRGSTFQFSVWLILFMLTYEWNANFCYVQPPLYLNFFSPCIMTSSIILSHKCVPHNLLQHNKFRNLVISRISKIIKYTSVLI